MSSLDMWDGSYISHTNHCGMAHLAQLPGRWSGHKSGTMGEHRLSFPTQASVKSQEGPRKGRIRLSEQQAAVWVLG